jgi:hypothetical protein
MCYVFIFFTCSKCVFSAALLDLLREVDKPLVWVHLPHNLLPLAYVFLLLFLFLFSTSFQNFDSRRRPIIALHSARKSVTPPAADAYNDEGEEEKEKEDEEETTRPSKRQRTSSGVPKSKSKNKGKAKAKAGMPVPSSSSPRFPPSVRKTRGKSKKDEAPLYVPPRSIPAMDTVLLASESVAKEQSEPTVVSLSNRGCPFF